MRKTLHGVSIKEAERVELIRFIDYCQKVRASSQLVLEHIPSGESASDSLLIGINDVFEAVTKATARMTVESETAGA